MKRIITLVQCLIFTFGYAQKCKYDVETTDAFTGKKTLGISAKLPNDAAIGFNLANDKLWVGLLIQFFGEKNEKIAQGDSLLLKLSNGEIITLFTNDVVAPTSYVAGSGGYNPNIASYYKPNYTIDMANMIKLSQVTITHLRVGFGANNITIPVDEKYREKIMKAARCILL